MLNSGWIQTPFPLVWNFDMKFIWFAITLCLGLTGVTAFVAWQAHIEAREARKEVLMFRQQQNDQIASGASPLPGILDAPGLVDAPAPPLPQLPPESASIAINAGANTPATISPPPSEPAKLETSPAPEPAAPEPLTAQQSHLLTLPAIAKVKQVFLNEGFVLIDAGSSKSIEPGMKFDVRRGASLVGRVSVTDAIEETESIADILPSSTPIGVEIKPDDELVQVVTPP